MNTSGNRIRAPNNRDGGVGEEKGWRRRSGVSWRWKAESVWLVRLGGVANSAERGLVRQYSHGPTIYVQ